MTVIHGSVNTLKITQHALNRCLQWQQTDSPNVGGLLSSPTRYLLQIVLATHDGIDAARPSLSF